MHAGYFLFICLMVGVTVAWKLQDSSKSRLCPSFGMLNVCIMPRPLISFVASLKPSCIFAQHCNLKLPLLQFSSHKYLEIKIWS